MDRHLHSISGSKERFGNFGFTSQEIRDLEFVYQTFDVNGRGLIEGEEVRKALKLLGFKATHKMVLQMLQDLVISTLPPITSKSRTRNVANFEGFLRIVSRLQGSNYDQYDEIVQGFGYLDSDKDGYVTLKDLSKHAPQAGLSSSDVQEMLAEADRDGDGKISKEEFLMIMKQTNLFQ